MVEKIKELIATLKERLSEFDMNALKDKARALPERIKELPARFKGLPERLRETDWRAQAEQLKDPKTLLKVVAPVGLALLLMTLFGMWLFRGDTPDPGQETNQAATADQTSDAAAAGFTQVPPPNHPFLFQPLWYWQEGDQTLQGSGFVVQTPDKQLIGVTAAAYLAADNRGLPTAVAWLPVTDPTQALPSRQRLGEPGRPGSQTPLDVRDDLNLFLLEGALPSNQILTLSGGKGPVLGTRIWFADKNFKAKLGFQWREGEILATEPGCLVARLDKRVTLGSQPGSPVFSQENGTLIGMVVRLHPEENHTLIYINPLTNLGEQLDKGRAQPMAALNSN
ncbi:hypothetical protein [Acanthopleuribacter pedis]|uniref:Uncharacterized protein n=1 Tax=Acanthopleuribacter pedis TaxID=442870 RepID=A0A8J7QJS4_9BACT|nr:hypothetical protein [Acanthopleuribacter pedis]MBO1321350.1 hypothetical protein [Acanthopleuribacter pedis]